MLMILPHTSFTTPHVKISSLDQLVDDIVIQIIQASSVLAVLALRQTSRRYYLLSKLRCAWYTRFCTDVLARNLPLPGPPRPLSLLSSAELEQRTLRALYLEQAWPRLSANTLLPKHYHHDSCKGGVDQVMFIPGGTELLTVQGDKVVHWIVVSWPGLAQGLKHVGEWTPFEGVPCRIVKDCEVPGVIAVGPRTLGSPRFAKVVSTSLKAPFVTVCHYACVPGILAGIWRHLLLMDTTREPWGGGLELLDWHAQTTGTALLPRIPDLFGSFLDFVVFSDHLLVVWEYCVSVTPVPHVPTEGQVVVEHKRVYMFQEGISRPVGFTTCVARRVEPPKLNSNHDLDQNNAWDMDCDWDEQSKRWTSSMLGMSPTLTIAARSRRRAEIVSMVMLIPLLDEEGRERVAAAGTDAFPYRLSYLPPLSPSPLEYVNGRGVLEDGEEGMRVGSVGDYSRRACTGLCLGWSGRGVFVVGQELRLVSPGLHILPPYDMQVGPVFETGEALYCLDQKQQRDLSWLDLEEESAVDERIVSGDKVDFDEGMGRFVVAREHGGFEIIQLE